MTVTYSVHICGGGIDSFLGFDYGKVITLTSRVFRVLLQILPTSLRFLRIFGFVGVTWCWDPPFLPNLTIYSRAVPLLGFWASLAFVRAPVALASIAKTITALILLLALRSAAVEAVFLEFRDFRASLGSS